MGKKGKVHLDARKAGDPLRMGVCGMMDAETTGDASRVTCKLCLASIRGANRERSGGRSTDRSAPSAEELPKALEAFLLAKAPAPPRLTVQLWAQSCKGGQNGRCRSCDLCAWHSIADQMHHIAPYYDAPRSLRPIGRPRWPTLTAALVALAEWLGHEWVGPSALGAVLDRAKRGDAGGGGSGSQRGDDALMVRAEEMVPVRRALEKAYPEGQHPVLSQAQCMRVLMMRTEGVLVAVASYEHIAFELGVTIGDLKALVRCGRNIVTVELAARGLIPMPRATAGLAEDIETAMRRFDHGR